MSRNALDALFGLGAALTGLLALWFPVPVLFLIGLGVGFGVHVLRRRRDKSAAARRAARRPLVEALWGHSIRGDDGRALSDGVAELLETEGITDGVVVAEFDPDHDRLRGYVIHPAGRETFDIGMEHTTDLAGRALRSGRPASSGAPGTESAAIEPQLISGTDLPPNRGWVALPLLDPAPPEACVDEGFLHRTGCPWRDAPEVPDEQGWRGSCAGCTHDPVRGVLAVRVVDEADSEGLADLLESLARTLGTILSLRRLGYRLQMVETGREQLLDAMLNGLSPRRRCS